MHEVLKSKRVEQDYADLGAWDIVQRRDHEYARLERGFAAPRRCQLFR